VANTIYADINIIFLSKINDYSLNILEDTDLEDILKNYLISSIPEFIYCVQNLEDRNDTTNTFNIVLTTQEINILATIMIKQWLNPKTNNLELLKNIFKTREFDLFSNANLLKELQNLRTNLDKEIITLMTLYHFVYGGGAS